MTLKGYCTKIILYRKDTRRNLFYLFSFFFLFGIILLVLVINNQIRQKLQQAYLRVKNNCKPTVYDTRTHYDPSPPYSVRLSSSNRPGNSGNRNFLKFLKRASNHHWLCTCQFPAVYRKVPRLQKFIKKRFKPF